ncbi:MAG: HD domain-containing protein [Bdellovibrio sp.]|nr:HD domain-containing protein [Bdellovibrio sp.]
MNRYYTALNFAAKLHDGQKRKGTEVPYLTHLMTVSSYVFEFGGTIEQAIAGLLHDAIEDQGKKISFAEIEKLFGPVVARIVKACTDAEVQPKPPWRQRKEEYLKHLPQKDATIKLVVACDKLHNAQSIVRDISLYGPDVWKRFNASPVDLLWYYESIVAALADFSSPVVTLLAEQVGAMRKLVVR